MKIANERVVLFHYILRNDEGEILDSSDEESPAAYLHGNDNIVDGLEHALEGKQAGDKFDVVVEATEGYGEYDDNLVEPVPKEQFDNHPVKVGDQFHAETAIGPRVVTVVAIDDENDQVVIDANHSLAGENLHFTGQVVEVREATKEELEQGDVDELNDEN